MEVRTFDKSVDNFFLSLESGTRGKVARLIELLEKLGHHLRLPYSKPIRQMKLSNMTSFQDLKKRMLADPEARRRYDELGPEFAVIESVICQRVKKNMTQDQLARKIGTKQSAIARLESGGYNPSLGLLQKVAKALGAKLKISIS